MLPLSACGLWSNSDPYSWILVGQTDNVRELPRLESSSPHSITSSARGISVGGTVRSSASAVLRLITSSNVAGCSTGMSAGGDVRNVAALSSASIADAHEHPQRLLHPSQD